MAKKIHIGVILASALLLLAALIWGMFWNYAQQTNVPAKVTAGGMSIGGMNVAEALLLLDNLEQTLLTRTIIIQSPDAGGSKQWSAQALGYTAEFAGAREALIRLGDGDIWARAAYRLDFQTEYPLVQSWDRDLFIEFLREQWGWLEEEGENFAGTAAAKEHSSADKATACKPNLAINALVEEVNAWLILDNGELEGGVPTQFNGKLALDCS
jgi:hypothetical protein